MSDALARATPEGGQGCGDGPLIWALSDGRAGNVAQAMGLAQAVLRRRGGRVRRLDLAPRPWAAWMPAPVWMALPDAAGWPWIGMAGPRPGAPWPDLVIGAGRRIAPAVAALRRQQGLRVVQILDPRVAPRHFDRLVVPDHDPRRGPGILPMLGSLGGITAATVAAAAATVIPTGPAPRLAVLLGGPSRSARFGPADRARLGATLADLGARATLMVTPSRRTPPDLVAALTAALPPGAVWNGTGANPYPGLLGHARAALVTADSVNMACEVASLGLPLHILDVGPLAPRLETFHGHLRDHGAARPFAGRIETWSYPPLAEADRIAALLDPLLPG